MNSKVLDQQSKGRIIRRRAIIVSGSDPAVQPTKTDQDIIYRGPTVINSLVVGDSSHAQGSRVDITFEGPTTLNFQYPVFKKPSTLTILTINGTATFADGLTSVSPAGPTAVSGWLVVVANGQLTIPHLLNSGYMQGQAIHPLAIVGDGLVRVGQLDWAGGLATLGSSETTIVIENEGRLATNFDLSNFRSRSWLAGTLRNQGTLFFGDPDPLQDIDIGAGTYLPAGLGGVDAADKLWLQNAAGATMHFEGEVSLSRINVYQDLVLDNCAGNEAVPEPATWYC